MATIRETDEFTGWLEKLRDANGKGRIVARIQRVQEDGHFGDVSPVGGGISEMRFHFGPGYRVYYKQEDKTVVLLYGGDKSSQSADIAKAKTIASELED